MTADTDYEIESGALSRVLRMGGTSLLERLIETALGNLAVRCGELAAALAQGDAAAAERAAHSIKSSSANLGASALSRQAERAEALAREGVNGWGEAAAALLAADLAALRRSVAAAAAALTAGPAAGDGS